MAMAWMLLQQTRVPSAHRLLRIMLERRIWVGVIPLLHQIYYSEEPLLESTRFGLERILPALSEDHAVLALVNFMVAHPLGEPYTSPCGVDALLAPGVGPVVPVGVEAVARRGPLLRP